MASPPSSMGLPKKRPSISGPSHSANPSKRRKPSTGPSGLRQTSFPPENGEGRLSFSRSPSVDSSFTANTATTNKRKKGGKGKGGADDDVRSTTGTSVRGGKGGGGAGSAVDGKGGGEGDEEDDDEGGEAGEALDAVLEGQGEADEKQEKEHMRMLVDHLDPDQLDRYAKFRAVKLKKEVVRKITNQTLSQSVPQSVVTTINSYTKVFIGSLIERARTIQDEWLAVAELPQLPRPLPNPLGPSAIVTRSKRHQRRQRPKPPGSPALPETVTAGPNAADRTDDKRVPLEASLEERLRDYNRGPLTPDHLREAVRRYKKDREGGAMGFLGLSLEGRERTAGRMAGKRLFK
ncbi:TAFII28-domain-containing protein [Saccharata proteae CBS 121410]|uniref:TAFII28-domain-containing protein n=1 Tax=Saccharata proteae CBS 121410 TaxID=1314787 RepID=A0A9P4HZC4_9PEZI|nr:TAFII28-domain-containing protein [Saccharata proteae CBS 121410]